MVRTLLASLALAAFALAAPAARAEDDANKCKIAVKGDNDVVKACTAGGIKRAKTVMKAMQKLAKGKGKDWDCNSCHKDESAGNWELTKDGEKLFKEMLEIAKAAK
jgi:hypothetical protein